MCGDVAMRVSTDYGYVFLDIGPIFEIFWKFPMDIWYVGEKSKKLRNRLVACGS